MKDLKFTIMTVDEFVKKFESKCYRNGIEKSLYLGLCKKYIRDFNAGSQ